MKAGTLTLVAITVVAVMAASIVGMSRMTRAIGPDVDNNGAVALPDVLEVIRHFGEVVSLPAHVEEQNVDANGYIRVHEQGVVDVNVTSGQSTLIHTESLFFPGGLTTVDSAIVDVSTCGQVFAMAKPQTQGVDVDLGGALFASPDGVTKVQTSHPEYTFSGATAQLNNNALPNVSFRVFRQPSSGAVNIDFWVFCKG